MLRLGDLFNVSIGWWVNTQASQKQLKILFLGIDNSGKTTLLRMLKDEVLLLQIFSSADEQRLL